MGDAILELVELLARLPGIGERTATRLAYHLLASPPEYAQALGASVAAIHSRVRRCATCGDYTSRETCAICADGRRDPHLVCVVGRPQDVAAVERGGSFRGRYHVLHALLSPLDGVGPDALRLGPLVERIRRDGVSEVILATPLSVEGEATALFVAQELKPLGVRCSRIASGLPHGGEIEFTDQITLTRALEGRRTV